MEQRQIILVTGAGGQVGSELKMLSSNYPQYDFYFTGREELSIVDENAVNNFFKQHGPQYCINCAAYTAVDKAENPAEFSLVTDLNINAVGYLARACSQHQTKLIHLSTDYVFDGEANTPYKEDDITNPVNVYGLTKLKGEHLAAAYTDATIIRTAWVYSCFGKNFVKTIARLMQQKQEINVVNDQYGAPTHAADLARAIMQIIDAKKWIPGIYHYSNEGQTSWYDVALAIKNIINANCEIKPISTQEYLTPAKRPIWSVLDKSKIKYVYQLQIPAWQDSLKKCLQNMNPTKA